MDTASVVLGLAYAGVLGFLAFSGCQALIEHSRERSGKYRPMTGEQLRAGFSERYDGFRKLTRDLVAELGGDPAAADAEFNRREAEGWERLHRALSRR